jgi:beta-lactamase regulating signal transducer with metallopeptidase domain
MEFLLSLAAKSLLIAGGTLLLLKLMQRRSSSDRSWVAHLGLLALLLLPVGTIALPALNVAGPEFLATEGASPVIRTTPAPITDVPAAPEVASAAKPFQPAADDGVAPRNWVLWAYGGPAALLVLLTLIALGRLSVLRRRAEVLTDTHWLHALAQAQHRMSFKNGTALLTSDELRSPISWGLMRPVILLNTDATKARAEAEAIIAHELAHVVGLDWAKLMLSRVAVAIFWFNPLVWLLAREAHQLREEAADDAVLAADIEDTEYANLLVGVARHECRGMLLGAHGVAPGKGSLTRRVKRVLDAALERAPGGWRWSSAAAFFAAGMAVPLAAIQFVSPTIAAARDEGKFVEDGAMASVAQAPGVSSVAKPGTVATISGQGAGPQVKIASIGPDGIRAVSGPHAVAVNIDGVVQTAIASATGAVAQATSNSIERAIELKAVGVSPQYAQSLRNAAPGMHLSHDDIVQLAATGVTADYVRSLAQSGMSGLDADDIVAAHSLGIDGAYIRGMANAGYRHLSIDDLQELKAVGVTPGDVARYRRANRGLPSVDSIVSAKAAGLQPEDIDPDPDNSE